ncbi:hypothetical protein AB4Y32_21615 [Paraburkholderia phymatum]|uniref:Uncharacterized protein n=1 Tax=Paraburkholderia phymatum TaxID=148447 RepID=A0ACC6U3Y1_9BURK
MDVETYKSSKTNSFSKLLMANAKFENDFEKQCANGAIGVLLQCRIHFIEARTAH